MILGSNVIKVTYVLPENIRVLSKKALISKVYTERIKYKHLRNLDVIEPKIGMFITQIYIN